MSRDSRILSDCFFVTARDRRVSGRFVVLFSALLLGTQVAATPEPAEEPRLSRPERVGFSSGRLERIGSELGRYVEQGKVPGITTVVARHGKLVHFNQIGRMDVEAKKELRPDTIFRIFSMTKPVTGVAMMILYEEGRYLMIDPVSKYLPEFEDLRVYRSGSGNKLRTEPARPMTIKHLLTHTSGLIYGDDKPGVPKLYSDADLWSVPSLEEFTKKVAALPLAAQPGTEWHYGVSMDVLGRLVEVLSKQPFDQFLAEHIFKPLEMIDTGFVVPEEKRHRLAALYKALPDGRMERVPDSEDSSYFDLQTVPYGGSGLVSTPADFLRFAQMLLNGGELEGVRILGRKTVDFMMMNHLGPELRSGPLGEAAGWYQFDPQGLGFGLTGAVVTDAALGSVLGSSGIFFWGGAASTHFWIDRDEDLIGMIFTQLRPSGTYPLRSKMRILTYQALIE